MMILTHFVNIIYILSQYTIKTLESNVKFNFSKPAYILLYNVMCSFYPMTEQIHFNISMDS